MFQLVSNRILHTARAVEAHRPITAVLASLMLVACSGDDGGSAPALTTGVFLDSSAVEGLGYVTTGRNGEAGLSGKTDRDGEFDFNAGDSVTFSLGGFALPTVQATSNVTTVSLFGAADANDPRVADLSRLLQSMDTDQTPDNGITLPLTVESINSDTQLDFGEPAFDAQATLVLSQVNESEGPLVDSETASAELTESLVENEVISDECTSEHPLVGRTAELSTFAHGVSGTLTVLNDCVIEVTNFNYDGGGPAVYFYAGVDRNYVTGSFPIGRQLNGQQWVNETLLLTIPEGKSLDDFNSLSVWCFDFNANFGDAVF